MQIAATRIPRNVSPFCPGLKLFFSSKTIGKASKKNIQDAVDEGDI